MPDWKAMIGHKTFDQLYAQAVTRLEAAGTNVTNLNVGGVFRTLLELGLQGIADLYDLLAAVVPLGFLRWSTGSWLLAKADDVGVTKADAIATQGDLQGSRTVTSGEVVIDEGAIFRTRLSVQGQYVQFRCRARTVMAEGAGLVAIPVECTVAGRLGNVSPGLITEMVTHVDGLDLVTNLADWITREGSDEESEASIRERSRLQWYKLSRGLPASTWKAWALEVPGVASCAVLDQFPRGEGTLDIVITGAAGQPTEALVAAVQAYLNLRRPNCADVLVRGPTEVLTAVSIRVRLPADRGEIDATRDAVAGLVGSLLASGDTAAAPRLGVGESLYPARLVALAMSVSPAVSAEVLEPQAPVVAAPGEWVGLSSPVVVTVEREAS